MFTQLKSPGRKKSHYIPEGPIITEQSHKDDCDMQIILKRYAQTGVITHNNSLVGEYADYPSDIDFHEAQNIIAEASTMFESVPARIRADFDNDPAKFLAFVQDEANLPKMAEYGLTNPLKDRDTDPVPEPKKEPKAPLKAKEPPPPAPAD